MALIDTKWKRGSWNYVYYYVAHLRQQCHNSKFVIFQEKRLEVLKCYTFLWVQRRHNCSPAASFADCDMTLYMLKVHLQTFLSIPLTQKCQILSCDTLVANERYGLSFNAARCTADVITVKLCINQGFTCHDSCSVHTAIKETLFAEYAMLGKALLFAECKTRWVCNFCIYLMEKINEQNTDKRTTFYV